MGYGVTVHAGGGWKAEGGREARQIQAAFIVWKRQTRRITSVMNGWS